MAGDIAVVTLMDAKEAQEVGRDFVSRTASLPLPVQRGKVVGLKPAQR